MSSRARVLVLNSALGPLDYRVPAGSHVEPGSVVIAPLGPRQLLGVVWEPERMPSDAEVGDNRLRPLLGVVDVPPLAAPLRRLIEWAADYYLAPPAAVVRMALASTSALEGARTVTEYRATGTVPPRLTPQREQALERIGDRQGLIRELATLADVSDAVVRGLVKAGALEAVSVDIDSPYPHPDPAFGPPTLAEAQQAAADELVAGVAAHEFRPTLLDGVTGSGKTEVYFEAVAEAIRQGRQTLVLLPEIALTEPFLKRFHDRFGCEPVAWHSGLRSTQRRRAWRAIASGEALVTVGARSALFLPYRNLGLIVVDEAHETSFKQEEGVHYHARDVAVMRGKFEQCPVILASATPAIETRQQVALGRYAELKLPGRYGPAEMPTIEAIDLIQHPPERGTWIAPKLVTALRETFEKGEQSLLFLNRRGYAPLTLCRNCGHRFQCPNCTAWMVEHRLTRRLACHHCGHVMPTPRACPECKAEDSLVACGPGVERIADEVATLFPEAKTAVVTSDTIWSPAKAAEFVGRMEAGDIDIVVGTQLVTKGYHFPNLTLVGVIDADLGLEGGDLRAAERTFQQIRQVSGRAGRGAKPGHVFIQTHSPSAQVMQALITGDAEAFYEAETEARRDAGAPPFGRYAAIVVSSEEQACAHEVARAVAQSAPRVDGMAVYGPAPAPLAMLRGRHRYRLLVHARRALDVQDVIRDWLGGLDWPAKARVTVDVDPYNFL
ncbi:primosomal protein N' [Sphingomonas melonis TY]|uniref:Replication restart protein PriA n=1 Tax=Sphingomonas melonis TY TaxID=621456 RepID=A0A175Y3E6_9SPHN|nr:MULTISPECIES: primosomal protein N' [Sphingomonas]AOW25473.1 primosomal protein N' [Sphingomonas melonis TY]ATI57441.1 primosomal protein N' [Sphingomonas melonis]KZB94500.1 primosomal protein N' [Sphingomonas melonis TY]MBI0529946.1 primosomal protein N' [Sphingomonas sp. TX0522]MBX8845324.1 primosomal protein N' [Sphingomonas melonis]